MARVFEHLHPHEVAAHEAAHVVTGLAVGLRLRYVLIATPGNEAAGLTVWEPDHSDIAYAIQYAAGVVWDSMSQTYFSKEDARLCRKHVDYKADVEVCKRIAKDLLTTRKRAHEMITKALLNADHYRLTGRQVSALIRGEHA